MYTHDLMAVYFYFNDTAPTAIYTYCHTLSLHDALPILFALRQDRRSAEQAATALIYLRRRDLQPQRFRRAGFQAKIRSTPLLQVASDSGRLHGRMKAAHALYQEWGEGWTVLPCLAPRPALPRTAHRRPRRAANNNKL